MFQERGLDNPLVFLGVVGEAGHPGFKAISGTLYVSVDADEPILREAWQETLARSPLANTLRRCVELSRVADHAVKLPRRSHTSLDP